VLTGSWLIYKSMRGKWFLGEFLRVHIRLEKSQRVMNKICDGQISALV
jgi:hypothetical protein